VAGELLQVDILGLRDLRGRFARMLDYELQEIALESAESLAASVQHAYQVNAPRGKTDKFMEGIVGEASWTGHGFLVSVTSADPKLREWLREGTGIFGPHAQPVVSPSGGVMVWEGDDGELVFASSTQGMPPNDWEVYANLEAAALVVLNGNKIGVKVVEHLAGVP
jgi:hypothetical protein